MDILELLPELVEVLFFGLGTAVLSIAGTYLERLAFIMLQSGDQTMGLWAGVMGAVVLTFAYLIGTDKFATKLKQLKRSADELSA